MLKWPSDMINIKGCWKIVEATVCSFLGFIYKQYLPS